MEDNIRMRLVIEGRVQGVWFRDSTRRKAVSLGVFGWVRNRPDGTVEVIAEGPEELVEELVSWCKQGSPASKVRKVHKIREQWKGEFGSFDILF